MYGSKFIEVTEDTRSSRGVVVLPSIIVAFCEIRDP